MWHQLLDKNDSYLETSASAMFTFASARGVNRGWLSAAYARWPNRVASGFEARAPRWPHRGHLRQHTAAYDSVYYYNRPTDLGAMQGYGRC